MGRRGSWWRDNTKIARARERGEGALDQGSGERMDRRELAEAHRLIPEGRGHE